MEDIGMNRNLRESDASEMLDIPRATLRGWRQQGIGPRWFRLGPRRVVYRESDLRNWINEQYAASAPAADAS